MYLHIRLIYFSDNPSGRHDIQVYPAVLPAEACDFGQGLTRVHMEISSLSLLNGDSIPHPFLTERRMSTP
jgi:hypothetical protein